jgi:hypothetical protein
MQPEMMIALANEVQRDRESERRRVLLRSLPLTKRAQGFDSSYPATGLVERLLGRISLRPRLF